jgi:hypothetical protein
VRQTTSKFVVGSIRAARSILLVLRKSGTGEESIGSAQFDPVRFNKATVRFCLPITWRHCYLAEIATSLPSDCGMTVNHFSACVLLPVRDNSESFRKMALLCATRSAL